MKHENSKSDRNVQALVPRDAPRSASAVAIPKVNALETNGGQYRYPTAVDTMGELNAHRRRRRWGVMISFVLGVIIPFAAACYYLFAIAEDQYSSTAGFSVRQEDSSAASELLGGLSQLAGAPTSSDSDILVEYIQSQKIVSDIAQKMDFAPHFSKFWQSDPVFSIWPEPSVEDLVWYWRRIVKISYDRASGLIEVRVLAFSAAVAQEIAQEIVVQSEDLINSLNDQARQDAMIYARQDLESSLERLKAAREELTNFRTTTQIVDPVADIQGRMGVMNNLQQQLAETLVEFDLLLGTTGPKDPRILQTERKISVIRQRIEDERRTFATDMGGSNAIGTNYPSLIAAFESLTIENEFAEQAYLAALTAMDFAKAHAARQNRYLAVYIPPTRAESAQYPRRYALAGLLAAFLVLVWAIVTLSYFSLRDRA
nr:sugar transporter [uncultured Shimia sp.]